MSRKTVEIKIAPKAAPERAPFRDLDTWLERAGEPDSAASLPAPAAAPSAFAGAPLLEMWLKLARINLRAAQALMQARLPGDVVAARSEFLRASAGVLLLGSGLFAEAAGQALSAAGRAAMSDGRD